MSKMTKTCDVCGASAPFMNLCITCSLWHSFQEIKIRGGSFQVSSPDEKTTSVRVEGSLSDEAEVDWVDLAPR